MSLQFKEVLASTGNYTTTKRSTSGIKYIVIHYTGNDGDTALNNCKYFQTSGRGASAHYFVDGGTYIYQSVLDTYPAWSVGGFYSSSNGAGSYYQKCTNANSISIEMCNCAKSVPDDVYEQTVELTQFLMDKYGITEDYVIRHWDVNGKTCPGLWYGKSNSGWTKFKTAIAEEVEEVAEKKEGCFSINKNAKNLTEFLHNRGYGAGEHNLALIAAANCKKKKIKKAMFKIACNGNLIKPDGLNKWSGDSD